MKRFVEALVVVAVLGALDALVLTVLSEGFATH